VSAPSLLDDVSDAELGLAPASPSPVGPVGGQRRLSEDELLAQYTDKDKWKSCEGVPAYDSSDDSGGGFFGFEASVLSAGVIGGGIAMLAAIVWFVVGLAAGWIFYYPPILFVIGLVAFIKGLLGED